MVTSTQSSGQGAGGAEGVKKPNELNHWVSLRMRMKMS